MKRTILSMIYGAALGLIMALANLRFFPENFKLPFVLDVIFLILLFLFYTVIQIFIHELGHLIFGWLNGYRLSSFRIFSFILIKNNNSYKFERFSVPGTGGQCLMKPSHSPYNKFNTFMLNVGGGLLNIITAALSLYLFFKFNEYQIFKSHLLLFSLMGLILAIMNLVPNKTSSMANDGYNIKLILNDSTNLQVFNEILIIDSYINRDCLYKEIPNELLYINSTYDYNIPLLTNSFIYYNQSLLEKEDYSLSYKLMNDILHNFDSLVPHYKDYLKLNLFYFDLLKQENQESLILRYDELKYEIKRNRNSLVHLRLKYAYYTFIEYDLRKQVFTKNNFYNFLKTYPFKADAEIEKNLFKLVDNIKENESIQDF